LYFQGKSGWPMQCENSAASSACYGHPRIPGPKYGTCHPGPVECRRRCAGQSALIAFGIGESSFFRHEVYVGFRFAPGATCLVGHFYSIRLILPCDRRKMPSRPPWFAKSSLQFAPSAERLAAVGAFDFGRIDSIDGNAQPDGAAVRALKLVIQIFLHSFDPRPAPLRPYKTGTALEIQNVFCPFWREAPQADRQARLRLGGIQPIPWPRIRAR